MYNTERLTTEVLQAEHAVELFHVLCDERVSRYIEGPDVTTMEELKSQINQLNVSPPAKCNETWLNFVVLLEQRVIGRIEATLHSVIAEITYVFGPARWGHGCATEAASWLVRHLSQRGVTVVWATVDPGDEASLRLLERLGFIRTQLPANAQLFSYDDGDVVLSMNLAFEE